MSVNKKDMFEPRTAEDAATVCGIGAAGRDAWAAGYNAAMADLLKLIPGGPQRRRAMTLGNRQHEVTAAHLGVFLLTANPKSAIWCSQVGYVRRVSLEVHGMGDFARPVVALTGRK